MTLSLSDENVDKSVIKIPPIDFELVSNTFCTDSELYGVQKGTLGQNQHFVD